MAERRLNYPHEPDKFGFDLQSVLDVIYTEKATHVVNAASGATLIASGFRGNRSSVLISDAGDPRFSMEAAVYALPPFGRVISTGLQTQVPNETGTTQHPDMFPVHFVAGVMQWYEDHGLPIEGIHTLWLPGDVVHGEFCASIDRGLPPSEAATLTIEGRGAQHRGFTEYTMLEPTDTTGVVFRYQAVEGVFYKPE